MFNWSVIHGVIGRLRNAILDNVIMSLLLRKSESVSNTVMKSCLS